MSALLEMENEGKLNIDYLKASLSFQRAMKKFQVKKVLYKTLFRGKGLEFEGYRAFDSDDDYNSIDWKASLRTGEKMVKQYKEERDVSVYFLVDCSKGMLFGSASELKAEYAGKLVCVLAHLVLNSGDKAGLIMYSDKEMRVLSPSGSKNQLSVIHKYLSDINNYGGNFEIERALEFSFRFLKGGSNNVVLVSDFIHLKKGFDRNLALVSSKADFFSIMVRDELDDNLPNENYRFVVQDPHSNKQMIVDTKMAALRYREKALIQKKKIKEIFFKQNIDLLELKNTEDFSLSLSDFMKRRAREIRT